MKLYIAEKPSLAKTIAKGLGGGKQKNGYIKSEQWCVTWCYGHMFELAQPEVYSILNKEWKPETLPIIPKEFELVIKKDTKDQIKVVFDLIDDAAVIINCGDPDREGQLLVDEVIEMSKTRTDVQRAWLKDLSDKGVKKALSNLESNEKYQPLSNSAKARSHADWLAGINLTRAHTIQARKIGFSGVLSVGRVQTPTLNLVVERDKSIAEFVSFPFYEAVGSFEFNQIKFDANLELPERIIDANNRCLDKAKIQATTNQILKNSKMKAVTTSVVSTNKSNKPPLPFELGTLQEFCNKSFGFSAQKTLDIAQSLYETHKATTYPRTDCALLAKGQSDDCKAALIGIAENNKYKELLQHVNMDNEPSCFVEETELGAHTGIIPTGVISEALNDDEAKVFEAIVRRTFAQYASGFEYEETVVNVQADNYLFTAKGKVIVELGFKKITEPNKEQFPNAQILPSLNENDVVAIKNIEIAEKKTTPPKHYTEATLIKEMMNISRNFEKGNEKEILKTVGGIGTSATRASIIETLKTRGFIEEKGKSLISTKPAQTFLKLMDDEIKSPQMTASWELKLADIADSKLNYENFIEEQVSWIKKITTKVLTEDMTKYGGKKCPSCHIGYLVSKRSSHGDFTGCTEYPDCKYIVTTNNIFKKKKVSKKRFNRSK